MHHIVFIAFVLAFHFHLTTKIHILLYTTKKLGVIRNLKFFDYQIFEFEIEYGITDHVKVSGPVVLFSRIWFLLIVVFLFYIVHCKKRISICTVTK